MATTLMPVNSLATTNQSTSPVTKILECTSSIHINNMDNDSDDLRTNHNDNHKNDDNNDGDDENMPVLLNIFFIRKKRFRVFYNAGKLVWERYQSKKGKH